MELGSLARIASAFSANEDPDEILDEGQRATIFWLKTIEPFCSTRFDYIDRHFERAGAQIAEKSDGLREQREGRARAAAARAAAYKMSPGLASVLARIAETARVTRARAAGEIPDNIAEGW